MNFYNYLNEIESGRKQRIMDILIKCKPFLKDGKKCSGAYYPFFYSGRQRSDNYFIGTVRKNRKPLSTKMVVHEKLDKAFEEKFGVKARSQSLFVTTHFDSGRKLWRTILYFSNREI